MTIIDRLLTPGASHGRPGNKITPVGVVLHYVGNPGASAESNRNWFENGSGGNRASAHYIVGLNGEILRLIPEDEQSNHAGKSYGAAWNEISKTNNIRYISVETCHPDALGRFSAVTEATLAELVADICVRRGFDPKTAIFRHYDVTGKDCPTYYVKNPSAWNALKARIARCALVARVSQKFGLNSPGVWLDYIEGKAIVSASNIEALFDKIAKPQ
jgi:N-acetylmuramoyl-L-alanine amidase